jgi:hypothetical protein
VNGTPRKSLFPFNPCAVPTVRGWYIYIYPSRTVPSSLDLFAIMELQMVSANSRSSVDASLVVNASGSSVAVVASLPSPAPVSMGRCLRHGLGWPLVPCQGILRKGSCGMGITRRIRGPTSRLP